MLQEAYLKLRMPGGKQHAANATSGAGYSSSSTTTTTTTHTNTSIVSAPALPAAAAAASLNPSDSKGLAVCMACLSMWAQPDSSGAYGFGSQAGVALASLAATIISQPHYHAVSNGGERLRCGQNTRMHVNDGLGIAKSGSQGTSKNSGLPCQLPCAWEGCIRQAACPRCT
eukprot:690021-Pelagomonas_calceolata.AAC.1